ncbi:phosphoribosylglycinamide formyltransferase [Rhodanobacter umsongensis]
MIRVALIASTGGAVYRSSCAYSAWLRERIVGVLSDRPCGALDAASTFGHAASKIEWENRSNFSARALEHLHTWRADLVVSFFTRILTAPLLEAYAGRLVNFHPSLLPACPGMNGFKDSLRSGALFLGSTVHLVDGGTDTGAPLIQAYFARDPSLNETQLRHQIFVHQCQCLIQLVRWYEDGRVRADGRKAQIDQARFDAGAFAPALDDPEAIKFRTVMPVAKLS